jgi:hypothetical protein
LSISQTDTSNSRQLANAILQSQTIRLAAGTLPLCEFRQDAQWFLRFALTKYTLGPGRLGRTPVLHSYRSLKDWNQRGTSNFHTEADGSIRDC